MRSFAYLSVSRCGVFLVRFVLPRENRRSDDSRDIKFSTHTKDPRHAKSLARRLRVLFELYLLQNVRIERSALVEYLRSNMNKPKLSDLAPFNADKDDNGNWRFTDVKPGDVGAIDAFLEAVNRSSQGDKPLSQVALSEPLPERFHEPGRLSSAARLRVSRHIADYLKSEQAREDDKEIGEKSVPQTKTRLRPFLERFGTKQIGTLTPADMEKFKKDLAFYPVNAQNLRHAISLTFDEIVSRSRRKLLLDNDGAIAECITESTLEGYVTVAINFLEFAAKQYAVNELVIKGFDVKTKARKGTIKRAFTQAELKAIFGDVFYMNANYNRSYQYWVPLLGLFTGARLNEISQLQLDDVRQDDAGLWYIDITASSDDDEGDNTKSVKNEESRRIVPVHQKLLDLGFIDFVKEQRSSAPSRKAAIEEKAASAKPGSRDANAKYTTNLFGLSSGTGDKFGKAPGRWFNEEYITDYLQIKQPEISFHSFRHRFVTSLAQAIVDSSGLGVEMVLHERIPESVILRRICGHSGAHVLTAGRNQNDVHTNTYTGAFSIASMKRVIDRLNFPGVHFFGYTEPTVGKRKRKKTPVKKIDEFKVSSEDLANLLG